MAGIVQQTDLGTGDAHQVVDVFGGFDVRAHVMMVRETNAPGERVPGQRRDALAVCRPFGVGREARPPRKRLGPALDRIRDLAVDHHFRSVGGEEREM